MNANPSPRQIPMARNSTCWMIAGFLFFCLDWVWRRRQAHSRSSCKPGCVQDARRDLLVADIYRPATPGKFPVLLQRTPYNRTAGAADAH